MEACFRHWIIKKKHNYDFLCHIYDFFLIIASYNVQFWGEEKDHVLRIESLYLAIVRKKSLFIFIQWRKQASIDFCVNMC